MKPLSNFKSFQAKLQSLTNDHDSYHKIDNNIIKLSGAEFEIYDENQSQESDPDPIFKAYAISDIYNYIFKTNRISKK